MPETTNSNTIIIALRRKKGLRGDGSWELIIEDVLFYSILFIYFIYMFYMHFFFCNHAYAETQHHLLAARKSVCHCPLATRTDGPNCVHKVLNNMRAQDSILDMTSRVVGQIRLDFLQETFKSMMEVER